MDEIIAKIEAADFYWAVCKYKDDYSVFVSETPDIYIADSLADGLGTHSGATPAEALKAAFEQELIYKAARDSHR